jgi:regulator of protease activity HflC (stomatin/prohibitin superfamily)
LPETSRKGLIIFGAAIAIILLVCLVAYFITGDQGIEERFKKAVGLGGGPEEEGGNGFLGFNIEGNILAYVVVLGFLIVVCVLAYLKFRGGRSASPRQ